MKVAKFLLPSPIFLIMKRALLSLLLIHTAIYCFSQSPAKHLVAFTHPENAASQRVLIKGGFQYIGLRETQDGKSAEFWLKRNPL